MRFLALLLTAASAFAAVDGVVINKTSGKPQAGANVTLLLLSAGMQPGGSAQTDAEGKFHFEQNLAGPALIQVHYQDVTYNQQIQPGTAAPHEIAVYETSKDPGQAKVSQHMLVLEPTGDQLQISETFFFSNTGNTTFHDADAGTLRFFVPKGANPPAVLVTGPNGMPLQRQPKTHESGVYSVDFPVRPGETRFDVRYTMPFTAPGAFSGRTLYKVATRFAVPPGVTLTGDGLAQIGQEPQSQALIYETAAAAYKLTVEGSGALAAASAAAGEEDSGPQIQQILPRIYDRVSWIVAAAMIALMCGFVILYRKGAGSYKA
ncbi:MAG TPA: hypothetical protein VN428_23695 [Bryobacteraceae bacterium]|nr:hypothetical protein [Bryobacteraceae bacterium]